MQDLFLISALQQTHPQAFPGSPRQSKWPILTQLSLGGKGAGSDQREGNCSVQTGMKWHPSQYGGRNRLERV